MTSLVAQMVKHLPTMRETRVPTLGWEDLLEKEMAIHSSILAWRIPWTEKPGRLQSMGSQRAKHDWVTSLSLMNSVFCTSTLFPPLLQEEVVISRERSLSLDLEQVQKMKLSIKDFSHCSLFWKIRTPKLPMYG